MPKTYSQLKTDEKCIYQAFTKAEKDTPQNMGDYVNSQGYDADDEKAVIELAARYGFNQCDMMLGSDYVVGNANFHASTEVICVITREIAILARVPAVSENMEIRTSPRDVLRNSDKSVTWHAIYGKVDANMNVIWHDDQKIFRNGPVAKSAAVYFSRKSA